LILALLTGFIVLSVGGLLMYHMFLIRDGLTTIEEKKQIFVTGDGQNCVSPFDHGGFWANVKALWRSAHARADGGTPYDRTPPITDKSPLTSETLQREHFESSGSGAEIPLELTDFSVEAECPRPVGPLAVLSVLPAGRPQEDDHAV
jgi:hypothetical protein